ncbi:MAG: hypothetical protein QW478_14335, partial [Candidatus Micrarchaeaceae archaeon]
MMATTTFHVEEDNIEIVQELTKTRELSKIINFLLREYRKDKGFISSKEKIAQLEKALKSKDEQYEALKK